MTVKSVKKYRKGFVVEDSSSYWEMEMSSDEG